MQVVKSWGLLTGGGRGKRFTIVRPITEDQPDERPADVPADQRPIAIETDEPVTDSAVGAPEALDIELFHLGRGCADLPDSRRPEQHGRAAPAPAGHGPTHRRQPSRHPRL